MIDEDFMSEFQYDEVTREDGSPVSAEELALEIAKPMPVKFDYNEFKGFTALFDRSKVQVSAVLNFQRASARLAKENRETSQEAEDLQEIFEAVREIGPDAEDAQVEEIIGKEGLQRLRDFNRRAAIENAENEPTLFPLKIEMLAPAIVEWNLPGEPPTVENLAGNGALALAVIPALWEAYRPFSRGSEAAPNSKKSPPTSRAAKKSNSTNAT
jgi:hypothetical protein